MSVVWIHSALEAPTQKRLEYETHVSDAVLFVNNPVDDEVDAGVQVREQRRVHVDGERESVEAVGDEYDEIGRP